MENQNNSPVKQQDSTSSKPLLNPVQIGYIILAGVLLLLSITFALQNSQETTIWFWGVRFTQPLALIVVLILFAGLIIGYAIAFFQILSKNKEIKGLQKKLKAIKAQTQD